MNCTCNSVLILPDVSVRDITDLVEKKDDASGHHVLWVCVYGHVNLTRLDPGDGPTSINDEPDYKFRLETFGIGNGYVGHRAALDEPWMKRLHAWIQRAWAEDAVGYVDF